MTPEPETREEAVWMMAGLHWAGHEITLQAQAAPEMSLERLVLSKAWKRIDAKFTELAEKWPLPGQETLAK